MKKFLLISVLFFLVVIRFAAAADDCSEFDASDFDEDVNDIQEINCAVRAGLHITNEQFQLTSYKQDYVLSSRVNLSDEAQRKELNTWLLFFFNTDAISGKEYSYAYYFDWVFSQENYDLSEDDLTILNGALNKSNDLLNNKISYFVTDRSIHNDTLLFLHLSRVANVSFDHVDGSFASHDFNYNGLGEDYFYTKGESASKFSFKGLKILSGLGFSDFYIAADGRLGALYYNGKELGSAFKTYVTSEGWVFENDGSSFDSISLPNGVNLTHGSAVWKDGVLTVNENSFFDWNPINDQEDAQFLVANSGKVVITTSDCERSDLSCLSYKKEEGKNVVSFYLKSNNDLSFYEGAEFNEDVSYFVDFINDDSSLSITQYNNAVFNFSKDDALVRGSPINDILFNRMYDEKPCNLYIGRDVTLGCGSSTSDPGAFSKDLRNNIVHMIENHNERIEEDGVGTFYGSESGSACANYNGVVNEQEMWVASALNNLRKKNICVGLNSCVNKVKSLRATLTDAQKVYYYFAVKGGKSDSEAISFAKNYDENSRLLGDIDLRDYTLGMSYCSDFVHRTLKRTYDDVGESSRFSEVETNSYDVLPASKSRVDSIHYMLMHYVLYEGWELVLLDPTDALDASLKSGKSKVFRKDGVLYVSTFIPENPKAEIKLVIGGYKNNANDPGLKSFAEKLGDKAGLVSIQYGYHAATLVAINDTLYLGEQHWSENEREENVELSPLYKHWLGHALVAVPPGVLD